MSAMRPPTDPSSLDEALVAELRAGRTIAAIKRYRAATGVGLADAKRYVDDLAVRAGVVNAAAQSTAVRVLLVYGLGLFALFGIAVVVWAVSTHATVRLR